MHDLALLFLLAVSISASGAAPAAADANDGILAFNRAFDAATRAIDNDAMLALWEDDGISLLPQTPPIEGKAAIAKFLAGVTQQNPGMRMESFDNVCSGIEVAGDWASEWCLEHQVVSFADGKPRLDGRGRMLLILHRGADGRWRLRREMWNQAEVPH